MDTSVALVQAYLHVNGYFTVAEYPVLEAFRGEHARSVTDLDILAFRFAGAGHEVIRGRGRRPLAGRALAPDPILGCPADRPDMIVGEVKEGAARLNAAMRDPVVLEVALSRFGCCPAEHAPTLTRQLLARGHATTPAGHSIRMVAFGDIPGQRSGKGPGPPSRCGMSCCSCVATSGSTGRFCVMRKSGIPRWACWHSSKSGAWRQSGVRTPNNRQKERTNGGVRVQRRS